jgi:hypothetical protein
VHIPVEWVIPILIVLEIKVRIGVPPELNGPLKPREAIIGVEKVLLRARASKSVGFWRISRVQMEEKVAERCICG